MNVKNADADGRHDVVLLHGWGTDGGVWEEVAALLAQEFRVHAIDLQGRRSGRFCGAQSLHALASQLTLAMPRPCSVVGWSLGALIALAWARLASDQVDRLALISATPCFARRRDWMHGLEHGALLDFEEQLDNDYEGTMRRFIALQVLGDRNSRRTARLLERHTPKRDAADMLALRHGLHMLLEADLRAELPAVRQPTLVLHGDRDRLIPMAAGRFVASSIAGARLEVVAGAAHAPFLSSPKAFSRPLVEFLRG